MISKRLPTGFGYGKRWTYKTEKKDETTPGPKYSNEQYNTIEYLR